MAAEVGAEGTTFSSVSVALSSELPGPAVPGFQNCSVLMGGGVRAQKHGAGVEGVARVTFREADVVRHDLVRRIVTAYEAASRSAKPEERG